MWGEVGSGDVVKVEFCTHGRVGSGRVWWVGID